MNVENKNTNLLKEEDIDICVANIYCFGAQKRTFCYKINDDQKDILGSIVSVSFGKKILTGIVLSLQEVPVRDGKINLGKSDICVKNIKNIREILHKNLLNEKFLMFLKKMALYNIIHLERLIENVIFSAWLNKKRELKQLKELKEKKRKKNNQQVIKLNNEQNNISNSIKLDNGFSVNLLYGVMGSGKTYIFLDIVRKILKKDNTSQILIMVPEIALTSNLIDIIYNFCNIEPIIWHSSVSIAKKKIYFENIINGNARIIISTRSGLLLPYKNLSLIVIDEEHDCSYKQDEIPVYNARDMAILRAKCENLPLILTSATPSLETISNVMEKKYSIFKINSQFFNTKPPKIEIINLLNENNTQNNAQNIAKNIEDKNSNKLTNYISKTARESIINTLKKHEQSMIFINRRGYSRTLKCNNCGYEIKCKNCDNLLSYHEKKNILKCHYCGYLLQKITICPNCKEKQFSASRGAGIEQIDKEIHSFCEGKTLLFSSDEINKEHDINSISNEIKYGDVDIIIGTQIVTKGHHFPRLTNIVVLDIDRMLLDGDFRAFERIFQMLFQLSGRAGREIENATVFIQTANPDNFTLQLLKQHDIKQFYKTEIAQRKKFNLPPYSRFIAIIISSKIEQSAYQTSISALKELKNMLKDVTILGPSECNLHFLKKNYRYRFLIKADKKNNNIFVELNNFYKNFNCPSNVQLKIDVDPYSFL